MLFIFIAFLIVLYIAWTIGMNDVSMALFAGSGFVTLLTAVIIGAIMDFLGASLYSYKVEKIMGKGLLASGINEYEALAIVFSMATWMLFAIFFKWPIAITYSSVGAVVGIGLYKLGIKGILWSSFVNILLGWILSPIFGFLGALLIYIAFKKTILTNIRGLRDRLKLSRTSAYLLALFSAATAFFKGANDIAKATAFLGIIFNNFFLIRIISGIGMGLGLLTLGRKLIKNVGKNLIELDPATALCAQLSFGVVESIGTFLGLPLSGTYILISSLAGIGVVRGIWINLKGLKKFLVESLLTFPIAGILSVIFYIILNSSLLLP